MKKCCHKHCNIPVSGCKDDESMKYNVCFHQFTEIIETIAKENGNSLSHSVTQSLSHLLTLGLQELKSLINVNVFNIFDFNNNNNVDYFEFFLMITLFRAKDCHGMISMEAKEREAKEYFDVFDKNSDHFISRQEVSLFFTKKSCINSLAYSCSMGFNFC